MNKRELDFYNELLPRIEKYKKPSKDQKLILVLSRINNRTDIQEKQLQTLVQVQMKTEELRQARLKASAIEKEKKNAERKQETRRKIIWGSALKQASKQNPDIANTMEFLFNSGYISDKDKEVVKSDIMPSPINH